MSDLRGQADDGGDLYPDDVSRAYRMAAREEPSPEVDDAIHAAALRAARSRPRSFARMSLRRWGIPIAVAATIVVGVSVAFLAADRPDSPQVLSNPSAPSPVAPPASADTSRGDSALEGPSQSAPGVTGGQTAITAAAREARPSRERTTRDQVVAKREQPAPVPPESSARPEAAPDATRAAPAGAALQAARPQALPDAATGVPKTAPGTDPQADQEAELLSPEVWLQRVRELRNKGELAQADESLRAFRRRYPDYPLPADVPLPAQIGK